ncbi:MAG: alpha/beta fold hydrolase [Pseudomonadota bacterium]
MSAYRAFLGGAGPPLTLIHGFGADRLAWAALVPALGPHATLEATELPAHGKAGRAPDDPSPRGLAAIVADAMDAAAPRPVVAHSLGATVALHLAQDRPGLVSRLVLIAPALWGGPLNDAFLRGLPQVQTGVEAQDLLQRLVANPRFLPPGIGDALVASLDAARRADWARIADALLAAAPPPVPDVPVTVLWGREDRINPHDPDALPDGLTATLIEGAGHLPHAEKSSAVARAIKAALFEHPPG